MLSGASTCSQASRMKPGGWHATYLTNPHVVVLARHPHDPTQASTTTPRPRRGFATVSRGTHQLHSRERVSKRRFGPARRGFGMAGRVPRWRESPNHLPPLCAQHQGRFSLASPILQRSHSRNRCANSNRYAALKGCYRNRAHFQRILSEAFNFRPFANTYPRGLLMVRKFSSNV